MTTSLQTLFLPFENGDVPFESPALFLGAAPHPALKSFKSIDLWQAFRPIKDDLAVQGWRTVDDLSAGETYATVLIHLPKQVEEAKFWIALALERLAVDGWLVVAAANDAGGSRIEGWLKEAGMAGQSLSKNKARAVWVRRPAALPDIVGTWRENGSHKTLEIGDGIEFLSQPGLFGWNKIDVGSRLLAENFSGTLKGEGADFGSGIGYLSYHVLGKGKPSRLHVMEADSRALACSEKNLEPVRGDCELVFHWVDLTKPVDGLPRLDFIVMNPPFHTGKKTEASLGQDFIRNAAHHLKKNGVLLMVANVHLPYEALLNELFSRVRPVVQKDGFKILEAVK